MRIAVVSDIHGNLFALEAVVRDFRSRGVDFVVNLGDSLSGPLLPCETAQFLIAQDWVHVAGNHERQLLTEKPGQRNLSDEFTHSRLGAAEFDWIASLMPTAELTDEVFACHATPTSDSEYLLETVEVTHVRVATAWEIDERLANVTAPVVLCGHTHIPRSVRTSRGQLIVNPGSVGLPAYDDVRPYPHRMESGSPEARYAIVENSSHTWSSCLVCVPYEHAKAADLARRRNRFDWAHALETGFVGATG